MNQVTNNPSPLSQKPSLPIDRGEKPTDKNYGTNFTLVETSDGSNSIFLRTLGEGYHSMHGAFTESRHVYLRNGFFRILKSARRVPVILEVGLGTGLNMALTYEQCKVYNFRAHYIALEPHPLPIFLSDKLNYAKFLDARTLPFWKKLHRYSWHVPHRVDENFCFVKMQLPIEELTEEYVHSLVESMDALQNKYEASTKLHIASKGASQSDVSYEIEEKVEKSTKMKNSTETVKNNCKREGGTENVRKASMMGKSRRGISLVYYDAFSPRRHEEVWHADNFKLLKSVASVAKPTILTTFSASKMVRKNLSEAGWAWESTDGILGKKEITTASTTRG